MTDAMRAALKAYEAWEADLVLNGDWRNELPRMTQGQFDRLLEIQSMRNAALAAREGVGDSARLRRERDLYIGPPPTFLDHQRDLLREAKALIEHVLPAQADGRYWDDDTLASARALLDKLEGLQP